MADSVAFGNRLTVTFAAGPSRTTLATQWPLYPPHSKSHSTLGSGSHDGTLSLGYPRVGDDSHRLIIYAPNKPVSRVASSTGGVTHNLYHMPSIDINQQHLISLAIVDICQARLTYSVNINKLLLRYHPHLDKIFNAHLESSEFLEAIAPYL